jgi:hypothetical protein
MRRITRCVIFRRDSYVFCQEFGVNRQQDSSIALNFAGEEKVIRKLTNGFSLSTGGPGTIQPSSFLPVACSLFSSSDVAGAIDALTNTLCYSPANYSRCCISSISLRHHSDSLSDSSASFPQSCCIQAKRGRFKASSRISGYV